MYRFTGKYAILSSIWTSLGQLLNDVHYHSGSEAQLGWTGVGAR